VLPLCFRKLRPSMMQHLLRRLVFDVPLLNEHTKMPLKVSSMLTLRFYSEVRLSSSTTQVFYYNFL